MIYIDYKDGRPIYEQITEKYKLLILKGALEPDEQMPSVRKLAMELSTTPNTVQKAYAELERQGFLYAVKGKGNFVNGDASLREKKKKELQQKLTDLIAEAEEIGISRSELFEGMGNAGRGSAKEEAQKKRSSEGRNLEERDSEERDSEERDLEERDSEERDSEERDSEERDSEERDAEGRNTEGGAQS